MSNYRKNKLAAIFRNTEPSKTDQSQARDTDVNHIIQQFKRSQIAPQQHDPGFYADLLDTPEDLRGVIEMSRSVHTIRKRLPAALREKPIEELLMLSEEDIKRIVAPPAPSPAPKPAQPEGEPK